ncbi:heavy-metal-associated domain-containing protein [Paenarthrobacter aurescens]|uniref:heavy-metal-associated domain-containing protein n=1 Tax=Paenarthrobacter aurescens TaxID=43663 RepID=UPI0002FA5C13|nr:heavy-metal-associated domain-containing protein [Paenarthrobacter aurescens]
MFKSRNRYPLPLAQEAAGCSCCSSEPPTSAADTGAVEFSVEGLTCGHCVRTVEDAVRALDGVESASVELVSGGRSRLHVSGKAAGAAIREAVSSAGYTVGNN